jgi:EAL domain-containing protein (putative c-di-GMP-specific phosphodiesterase class I)
VIDEIVAALDTRQFVPHYQPKVCLVSGELLGVEALARWEHVELGLLAPAHFVDLMESNELIDPLTHLILEQAGHHAMAWAREGLHVPISVNLSPLSLEQRNCAKQLLATIAATGADPSQFTFEITEKAFAKDTKTVLENVLRLRMRGCGISVDDFGTGYSSLQQLNRTPITELKLDRSFVRRIMSNSKALSIVGSMIDLATRLKLKTVAEGVDNEQQRDRLEELGCDMGQGYLFAKAMESELLVRWWEAHRPVPA